MTNYKTYMLSREVVVDDYDLDIVNLPFSSTVHLPFGSIDSRPSAWLRVYGAVDGLNNCEGVAEGTSLPMQIPMYDDYSGNLERNIESVMLVLMNEPSTFGRTVDAIRQTNLDGNFATARMTVEASLIDMIARAKDTTVAEMIGAKTNDGELAIPYGKSIAEKDTARIVNAGEAAISNGAKRLKFKLSPANHMELLKGLQELQRLSPEADLMVDANGSFDPSSNEHLSILKQFDRLGLLMIEEPVSRVGKIGGLAAHRMLQDAISLTTPICLDDSVASVEDAVQALEENLGGIINIKPGRVGSFISCLEIIELAKSKGKQVMVGGMYEATPGRMMTLTLAAFCIKQGFSIPGDVSLPQERLTDDLVEERLQLDESGNVLFSPKTGWGYTL